MKSVFIAIKNVPNHKMLNIFWAIQVRMYALSNGLFCTFFLQCIPVSRLESLTFHGGIRFITVIFFTESIEGLGDAYSLCFFEKYILLISYWIIYLYRLNSFKRGTHNLYPFHLIRNFFKKI